MTKIFNIGLAKTGTTSIARACNILGYSTCHFPQSDNQIKANDMSADITVAYQFEKLDKLYPNSKFILSERDKESWLNSSEKHWELFVEKGAQSDPNIIKIIEGLYGEASFDRERFSRSYDQFDERVNDYFQDRPADILHLSIFDEPDPWRPLCNFLGKDHPGIPFPHANPKPTPTEARRLRIKNALKTPFRPVAQGLRRIIGR